MARENGWKEHFFAAKPFGLVSFYSNRAGRSPGGVAHIYIEGDGFAWRNRATPSEDPTPLDPIGLKMAMKDPAGDVVYLARPCQYIRSGSTRACNSRYWTSHRFAPEVVAVMNQAVDSFKAAVKAERVRLYGYSGGGVLAALVAARRNDVESLVTAASPIDQEAWIRHHRVTPLSGSLNPARQASRLASVPQVHLVGCNDKVTPKAVAESYIRALPQGSNAKLRCMPRFDHRCCWARDWSQILRDLGSSAMSSRFSQ